MTKNENMAKNLQTIFSQLLEVDLNQLIRPSKSPGVTFEEVTDTVKEIQQYIRSIEGYGFGVLPVHVINDLINRLHHVLSVLSRISAFEAKNYSDFQRERNNIIQELSEKWNQFQAYAFQYIPYVLMATQPELLKKAKEAYVTMSELDNRIKEKLESIQVKSGEAGTAVHAGNFGTEAQEHNNRSRAWGLGVGCLIVITIYIGSIFWRMKSPTTLEETIQVVFAKFVIMSAVFSGLYFCVRNYLAHLHNYTLNRHRKIALDTFGVFANAAGDAETKKAVLLQVTHAVFAPQKTGFLRKDSGGAPITPNIIELIQK